MNRTTKAQLQSELQIADAKIERLSRSLVKMREIVSVQKCLNEAREVLAANPKLQGAELLAAFISRVWWIDVEPEQLKLGRGETTTSLPPLSPQG